MVASWFLAFLIWFQCSSALVTWLLLRMLIPGSPFLFQQSLLGCLSFVDLSIFSVLQCSSFLAFAQAAHTGFPLSFFRSFFFHPEWSEGGILP